MPGQLERAADQHRHLGLLERIGHLPGLGASRDHRLELELADDLERVQDLDLLLGVQDHRLLAAGVGDQGLEPGIGAGGASPRSRALVTTAS